MCVKSPAISPLLVSVWASSDTPLLSGFSHNTLDAVSYILFLTKQSLLVYYNFFANILVEVTIY